MILAVVLAAALASVPLTCIPCEAAMRHAPPHPVTSPLGLIVVEKAEMPWFRERREQYEECSEGQRRHGWAVYCIPPWEDVAGSPIFGHVTSVGTTTPLLGTPITWSTP